MRSSRLHWIAAITSANLLLGPIPASSEEEIKDPQQQVTPGATDVEISKTLASPLMEMLSKPITLGFDRSAKELAASSAKSAYSNLKTDLGDVSKSYDIIIQPGHFGRTSGATGGQGKFVSEQQYAAWIVSLIAADLKDNDISVAVIPADDFNQPLKAKVFIAFHTDASNFPCSVGPSIGYRSTGDSLGMHGIAAALAITLDIEPEKFMRDNYTKNLSGYYAYSKTNVSMFEGLLEMGELTCTDSEEQLLQNAETLARNLSWAIRFAIRPPS